MRRLESAGAVQDRVTVIDRAIHGGDVVEDVAERQLQNGGEAVGDWQASGRAAAAIGRLVTQPSATTPHINNSVNAGAPARSEARRVNANAPATDSASIAGIANRAGTRIAPKTGSSISQA